MEMNTASAPPSIVTQRITMKLATGVDFITDIIGETKDSIRGKWCDSTARTIPKIIPRISPRITRKRVEKMILKKFGAIISSRSLFAVSVALGRKYELFTRCAAISHIISQATIGSTIFKSLKTLSFIIKLVFGRAYTDCGVERFQNGLHFCFINVRNGRTEIEK
jgi:hypothetical protein